MGQSLDGLPRVMIVADHLGYAGGVVHGVTTYFLDVLPALAEAGVALTVCYLREPHPAADALRERGISPVFLSAARMNPFVAVQVATLARRNHCDVLHAMGIKGTLMARLATRMVPARTILHLHDLIEPGPLVGQLQRTFARDLDMAVCVASAAVPIAIHRYKVEPGRVRVIHNGIRLERYERVSPDARDRLRGSLGVSDRERVLMLVGRMHPIKGHRTMLRMMPGIIRQCAHAVLWLAGDGPDRSECEAMARELGLQDRIRFLGQRRDVPELLAACDVVVVPSQSEGLPIAAIEAHAAGRPVVGFDVGGVGEVVEDGASGRVVTAADEIAFIDAAAALLNDDPARAEYGATARARAQEFSLEAHVTQLVQCYRECAAAPAQ
jgi:glycosyltransferase involved in cell wall biosynthesis